MAEVARTKVFVCRDPDCDKEFRSRSGRANHELKHEPAGTTQDCLVCGAPFSRKSSLVRHQRVAHPFTPFPRTKPIPGVGL